MSLLNKWFGPKAQPDDESPADSEPGVIEGVKRKPQKRYAQRWYQRMRRRRCKTTVNSVGGYVNPPGRD